MTTPGSAAAMNAPKKDEGIALSERISAVFAERFDRLDRLQNAKTVTEADREFLDETEKILNDLERRDAGTLEEGPTSILENLRIVLDAAESQYDRAKLVAEGEEKKKKSKKPKKEKQEESPAFVEEELVEPEAPAVAGMTEKDFAGDEVAEAWFAAIHDLEKKVSAAEYADASEQAALFERATNAFNLFMEENFNVQLEAVESAGESVDDFPLLTVLSVRVDGIADRLEKFYANQVVAEAEARQNSPEYIGMQFEERIPARRAEIDALRQMSLESLSDVAAASAAFDRVIADMREHGDTWRSRAQPILDAMKQKRQRWGDWAPLAKEQSALMLHFFGRKAKADGSEKIEGVIHEFGRRLRERRAELWNEEFPNFSLRTAKEIVLIQDARLRRGEERVHAMQHIQSRFLSLKHDWETLRLGGPRYTLQERIRGQQSPVRRYDVMMRQLERDIPRLVKSAPKARPARLDDVAFLWREALVRTDVLWNEGTTFQEKIAFLRRYGNGMADEAEIHAMIVAEEQENFIAVAQGDVLKDLRALAARKQERREETERRERAQLYHPALEMFRMEARGMYRSALNASFWKKDVSWEVREHVFSGVEHTEEDRLNELVTDVAACRRMLGMVSTAYARAKTVEDQLYLEGKAPEKKVKAKQLRSVIDRYLKAEEKEVSAWKNAKYANGWGIEPSRREGVLHYEFRQFLKLGERAFRDKEFLKAPPELRKAIVSWCFLRMRLRTFELYTQWLIDQNPVLARAVTNMPRVFVVPEIEKKQNNEDEDTQEDDEAQDVEVSKEEKEALALPVQVERSGDEAGGGAFDDIETAAAADSSTRGGEEQTDDDDTPVQQPGGATEQERTHNRNVADRNVADRNVAVEEHGEALVKALSE